MSALSNLLTVAAIALAYWLGRQHQARQEAQHWHAYQAWLREARGKLTGRFLDIRA